MYRWASVLRVEFKLCCTFIRKNFNNTLPYIFLTLPYVLPYLTLPYITPYLTLCLTIP